MENKLFRHEIRGSWRGFGVINLLMIISLITGLPVKFHSDSVMITAYTSRASYTEMVLLTFLALLVYGMYQLFRELYVTPSGLIFTVPADIHTILTSKLRAAFTLTMLSIIVLYAFGHALSYTEGTWATLSSVYLIMCSYAVMLAAGFRRIALCHQGHRNATATITAGAATIFKGAGALALYLAVWYVLLIIITLGLQTSSWLIVSIVVAAAGVPLLLAAKGYLKQTATILGGGAA